MKLTITLTKAAKGYRAEYASADGVDFTLESLWSLRGGHPVVELTGVDGEGALRIAEALKGAGFSEKAELSGFDLAGENGGVTLIPA